MGVDIGIDIGVDVAANKDVDVDVHLHFDLDLDLELIKLLDNQLPQTFANEPFRKRSSASPDKTEITSILYFNSKLSLICEQETVLPLCGFRKLRMYSLPEFYIWV